MKRAVIVAALIICMPYSAFAVPFDAIVPSVAQINTEGGGISRSSWGWIAAVTDTISLMDLQDASFTASTGDPDVTVSMQDFLNESVVAPLLSGQVAGLSSAENAVFNDLLDPGEALVNVPFWFIEFQFPFDHISTTTLAASVTIGGDVVNYTSELTLGPSGPFFLVTEGQRLSSGGPAPIPEPGTLLLIGSGLFGLGAGAWRRKKH